MVFLYYFNTILKKEKLRKYFYKLRINKTLMRSSIWYITNVRPISVQAKRKKEMNTCQIADNYGEFCKSKKKKKKWDKNKKGNVWKLYPAVQCKKSFRYVRCTSLVRYKTPPIGLHVKSKKKKKKKKRNFFSQTMTQINFL